MSERVGERDVGRHERGGRERRDNQFEGEKK